MTGCCTPALHGKCCAQSTTIPYTESQLLVLFADGALCGSTVTERVLSTVWSVPVGADLGRLIWRA